MDLPDPETLPRREYLRSLVAAGGAAALAACLDATGDEAVPTGTPDERPRRQHAWNDVLDRDEYGNIQNPNHHILLALDLRDIPDEADRSRVETAFQSLERAYGYDPEGLLFTVGYAPSYFEQVGVESPIPQPAAITSREAPEFDEFDALVHLASNNPDVVLEAEEALLGDVTEPNGVTMDADLTRVFERGQPRRTGFVGPGLPATHTDMAAVPDSVPEEAPFFMGFKSGFANSQAPEERITIQDGPYAGGTTRHVESLDLQLRTWFEQDDHFLRVAQLFSPEHAKQGLVPEVGDELGNSTDIEQFVDQVADDARDGLVGHAKKAARARDVDGTPKLLRRDFNTTDGDFPGVPMSGDADFVVRYLPESRLADGGGDYLFVSPRTPYNRVPLPDMSLTVEGDIEGQLTQTLDSELGHHYGMSADLAAGDTFDIVTESPPQVARHRGYETAFIDMPPVTVEVP